MAGKHAAAFEAAGHDDDTSTSIPKKRRPRLLLPIVTSAAVLIVAAGTATVTLTTTSNDHPKSAAAATHSSAPSTSPTSASPSPTDRTEDMRASRGLIRVSHSPSPSPSPTPSEKQQSNQTPPADNGNTGGASGTCQASFYGDGQSTASGEPFNPNAYTAAHKTLPFGTKLRVTNLANGKSVVVRINDRGPYVDGRCLDLTTAAFDSISSESAGTATVKYQII